LPQRAFVFYEASCFSLFKESHLLLGSLHKTFYVLIKREKQSAVFLFLTCFFSFLKKTICFLDFLIKLSMFNQKGKTIRCFSFFNMLFLFFEENNLLLGFLDKTFYV